MTDARWIHPLQAFDFSGQKVFITGATGGIGMALADAFFACGAHLILSARRQDVLRELQTKYGQERCSVWPLDLKDHAAVRTTLDEMMAAEGCPHVVINNGGCTQDTLCIVMKDAQWQDVIDVDLSSAFYITRAVAKGMLRRKGVESAGRIINIASIVGVTGNAGQANYAAAKAGLIAMTKSVAQELAKRAITVNAIAPGFITTPMTEGLPESVREQIPMARYGTPEDVAACAVFLASPWASYMTGQTLHPNGGLAMI